MPCCALCRHAENSQPRPQACCSTFTCLVKHLPRPDPSDREYCVHVSLYDYELHAARRYDDTTILATFVPLGTMWSCYHHFSSIYSLSLSSHAPAGRLIIRIRFTKQNFLSSEKTTHLPISSTNRNSPALKKVETATARFFIFFKK